MTDGKADWASLNEAAALWLKAHTSDFAERAFVDGADWSTVCVEVLALWASKQIAAKAGEDAEKLRWAMVCDAKERAAEASHEAMVAAKFTR